MTGGGHDPSGPLDLLLIPVIFLKKNYKINEMIVGVVEPPPRSALDYVFNILKKSIN